MAIYTQHAERRRAAARHLLLFTMILLCLPGCGGCHKTPEAQEQEKQEQEKKRTEEKAKKKEKPKDPFEVRQPATMPPTTEFPGTCKPGHWVSQVWPDVKANLGDFQGELQTDVVVGRDNHKLPLAAVPYTMTNVRSAVLAKEQPKSLESFTWVPPGQNTASVDFRLVAGGGGALAIDRQMNLSPMPSYRYYFVVLSRAAGRYEYLEKRVASIRPHRPGTEDYVGPKYYEVVSLSASRRPSLPTSALYWTSIAYLLWDDFDPAQWDGEQQQALIDWLHWGGQIIVSGPDALEQLRNSFLRAYLPATVEKTQAFSAHDMEELSYWDWADGVGRSPNPVKPWSGAKLKKDPQANYLPYTNNLLVERKVGRGRIVASAFRLTGPELTGWPGFDCFFNACLLRRPARVFPGNDTKEDNTKEDKWSRWAGSHPRSLRLDAAQMTKVRYFVRDTGVGYKTYAADFADAEPATRQGPYLPTAVPSNNPDNGDDSSDEQNDEGRVPAGRQAATGLGAWRDFGPVPGEARAALVDAGGIRVPERSFIVWVVVGYLCVLVPANWLVFRLLGRVEWAWIAAPLIAIACTVVVIQQAQVNIGFARSRNEIAVIEMQAGYARVHETRYTALYTSLATRYELRLDDPAGQIMPFPRVSKPGDFTMQWQQTPGDLVCRRGDGTQLSGFSVASNDVDYVHSERMADFDNTLVLREDGDRKLWVTNRAKDPKKPKHPLVDCQVIRRGAFDRLEMATVGRLDPGADKPLEFRLQPGHPEKTEAKERPRDSEPSGELSIQGIIDVARDHLELRPGEICLLARVDDDVPGLTVTPATPQTRQAALLVAHLKTGDLHPPEADRKESSTPSEDQSSSRNVPNTVPVRPTPIPEVPGVILDTPTGNPGER